MPTTPDPGSVRSAAVVNADIRALWERAAGRALSAVEQEQYQRLLVEWASVAGSEPAHAA
ncbi:MULTISPECIES: hypothetical protein [unclassified Streptomyces]|uniref:hypothetical protein n=1 Tax=unclassified Streptomyces TaxID=2593676 RepID=UPI000B85199A|nr:MULTISPECIES: hypothetical protein [unclassified Streptomyces]MYZ35477.1 hypothetical protein [Streptomyces sp. SID4917]